MLAFEFSEHKAVIDNNEEGRKIADALRNKLTSDGTKFQETDCENVIYFKWLESKLY